MSIGKVIPKYNLTSQQQKYLNKIIDEGKNDQKCTQDDFNALIKYIISSEYLNQAEMRNIILNCLNHGNNILIEHINDFLFYGIPIAPYDLMIESLINQRITLPLEELMTNLISTLDCHGGDNVNVINTSIKLLISNNIIPTPNDLWYACRYLNDEGVKLILDTNIKPTKENFISIINNARIKNINILCDYGFYFETGKEFLDCVNKNVNKNSLQWLDISKLVKKIDILTLQWCYKYNIPISSDILANCGASGDQILRAACAGTNLKVIKDIIKQYKIDLNEECLKIACKNINRKLIKFLVDKGVKMTDACIVEYAKNLKNAYLHKLIQMKN